MKKFITICSLALFLMPLYTFAEPIIRSGESVSVEADQLLEGDFYARAGTLSISGTAEHDVVAIAGSITINAEVKEDLTLAGGTIQVHAPVGDDLRVAGGEVVIANTVEGDVFVFAGVLKVLSTARINGDIVFYGGEGDISGDIGGSVLGTADTLRIDAEIGGDVDVVIGSRFEVGTRTEVVGNVTYRSDVEMARAQEAVIYGDVHRESVRSESDGTNMNVVGLLMYLFAALFGYLLFKRYLQRVSDTLQVQYGLQGLIGLSVFISTPLVIILLTVSVLGVLPGIILLCLYIALLCTAAIAMGPVLGAVLMRLFVKTKEMTVLAVFIGVVSVTLMALIPFVGGLLILVLFFMTLGSIATRLYKAIF